MSSTFGRGSKPAVVESEPCHTTDGHAMHSSHQAHAAAVVPLAATLPMPCYYQAVKGTEMEWAKGEIVAFVALGQNVVAVIQPEGTKSLTSAELPQISLEAEKPTTDSE